MITMNSTTYPVNKKGPGRPRNSHYTTSLDPTKAHAAKREQFYKDLKGDIEQTARVEKWTYHKFDRWLSESEAKYEKMERELVERYLYDEDYDERRSDRRKEASDIIDQLYEDWCHRPAFDPLL